MRWFRRNTSQQMDLRQALHDPAMRITISILALLLVAQGAFWNHTRAIMPEMGIVPDVLGERTIHALSFGDEEAFFRLLALNIQNSGDTFGRFTALYKYDFKKLYNWFHMLDKLNRESSYLPAMASYYFSQTQNPSDVRYIIDYLDEYTDGRAKEKWWWVVQGAYLASHKLKDDGRALELANKLQGVRGIPVWARQLSAFLHEKRGEFGEAMAIIDDAKEHPEDYTQGELNFVKYFIDERLHRLNEVESELKDIQKEKDALKARGIKEPEIQGPPGDVGAVSAPVQ